MDTDQPINFNQAKLSRSLDTEIRDYLKAASHITPLLLNSNIHVAETANTLKNMFKVVHPYFERLIKDTHNSTSKETWSKFLSMIKARISIILDGLIEQGYIHYYRVICDGTNNTEWDESVKRVNANIRIDTHSRTAMPIIIEVTKSLGE